MPYVPLDQIKDKVIAYNKQYPIKKEVKSFDEKTLITVKPLQGSAFNAKKLVDVLVFGKDYKTFTK